MGFVENRLDEELNEVAVFLREKLELINHMIKNENMVISGLSVEFDKMGPSVGHHAANFVPRDLVVNINRMDVTGRRNLSDTNNIVPLVKNIKNAEFDSQK
ncbi:MAG: hypothetical protein LZF61_09080 [Nitrosomonas sp.]|nr:MAG: hypothetical protein LZF61_09080 [Nitrosomonas sp.]